MVLSVNEIYKIANNMFQHDFFNKTFSFMKQDYPKVEDVLSYEEFIIYNLQNSGGVFSLFTKKADEEICLYQEDGRIYYEIVNDLNEEIVDDGFITNEILFKFPLTLFGESFIKKFV